MTKPSNDDQAADETESLREERGGDRADSADRDVLRDSPMTDARAAVPLPQGNRIDGRDEPETVQADRAAAEERG